MATIQYGDVTSVEFESLSSFTAVVREEKTGEEFTFTHEQIGYIQQEDGETVITRRKQLPTHLLLTKGDRIAFVLRYGEMHRWVFERDALIFLHKLNEPEAQNTDVYEPCGELHTARVIRTNIHDRVGVVRVGERGYEFRMQDRRSLRTIGEDQFWIPSQSRADAFPGDTLTVEINESVNRVRRWSSSDA